MATERSEQMRLAYLVSRFPATTETFVLRELQRVSERDGVKVELLSLFPARDPAVHPGASRWAERLHRPGILGAGRAMMAWSLRRPLRVLSSIAIVVRGSIRRPALLVRSLATLPVAAAHASLLGRLRVQHVHAHFASYPAQAGWFCQRLTGISFSFTAHGFDLYLDPNLIEPKLEAADFAVAASEFHRRLLGRYEGNGRTPVHVVGCGIDLDAFPFRPRRIPPHGPVRALCVASLDEWKGHAVLFEAVAGGGPLSRLELDLVGDGEQLESLRALADELGISERVSFHGSLPEPGVKELLSISDLFVLPSLMEGLPISLVEAVASGLPAVASRTGAIPELIRDREVGLLATPGDPKSLRAALECALSGEPVLDAGLGRRIVEQHHDLHRAVSTLVGLYRDSIKHPSGMAPGKASA